jgi:hypothetical protein
LNDIIVLFFFSGFDNTPCIQVQPNLKCFPVNKNKTKIPILEGLGAASKDAKLFVLFIIQNRFWTPWPCGKRMAACYLIPVVSQGARNGSPSSIYL